MKPQLTQDENHAVDHLEYLVSHATPEKPEVCVDYELAASLLKLIERLRKRHY